VPLQNVAVIGKLFRQEQRSAPAGESAGEATVSAPVVDRSKPEREVVASNLGMLATWTLPSPYDESQLRTLVDELKSRRVKQDLREAELDRREAAVGEQRARLAEQFDTLEQLKRRLETFEAELVLREREVARDEGVAAQRLAERWAGVARIFDELDGEEAGARLAEFPPEDAARLLRTMTPERAAELLNALPRARWKEYVDAYSAAAPPARAGR
jgi:flagellar motility protein MotE (MotC chaperone)